MAVLQRWARTRRLRAQHVNCNGRRWTQYEPTRTLFFPFSTIIKYKYKYERNNIYIFLLVLLLNFMRRTIVDGNRSGTECLREIRRESRERTHNIIIIYNIMYYIVIIIIIIKFINVLPVYSIIIQLYEYHIIIYGQTRGHRRRHSSKRI